ncbi:MAG: 50S ribosomal protein L25 [bacterium]|nr:50S ribosomal protein L25 [bacterium]
MDLNVQPRTILGRKAKTLWNEGLIPAEIYGHGEENKHISIPEKEFAKIYKEAGEYTVIQVAIGGKEKVPALIVEVQKNPITGRFFSVDLHQIRMDEEIQTHIPIECTGEAPGVKLGLILVKVLEELEIEALPANLPHKIEVSLETLKTAGDTIHVSDLNVPENVKVLVQPETVVVTLSEPEGETEEPKAAEGEKKEEEPKPETEEPEEQKPEEK